jgi:hypothetical protein
VMGGPMTVATALRPFGLQLDFCRRTGLEGR